MILISELRDDVLRLSPCDEWDEAVQAQIADQVRGRLAVGVRSFLVNLERATHIRYGVLAKLRDLHGEVRRAGGELVLAAPSFYLLEILAAGDVPRTIPVYPSEASAAMGISQASAAFFVGPQEGERRGSGLVI